MKDGGRESDVVIGNVSTRGLMAKCARPPANGARVEIAYKAVRITGRVIWSKHRRFGLQSDEPIDVAGLFPIAASGATPQAPRRFTPPQGQPAPRPRQPMIKRKAPRRVKSAWRDPLVAVLVAMVTTSAIETGIVDFSAAWDVVRHFIPG